MRGRKRILTLQLGLRELGRLRTGTFEKPQGAKGRPKRSDTWIVTSRSEDYIAAAAAEWGGTPERWQPQGNGPQQYRVITGTPVVDAFLPPGDQLSQAYELWNKGGCVRRCDGMSDDMSGGPCICRQKYGDEFGAREDLDQKTRDTDLCKATTRLNVVLPALPDLGVWRAETHSYYAAAEMSAAVDAIRGLVGPQALVPIRLRIEQRSRVAGGKRKDYPVIVVELAGSSTAGQMLAGDVSGMVTLDPARGVRGDGAAQIGGPERRAIEAGTETPDWWGRARATQSLEDVRSLWKQAHGAGALDGDPELKAFLKARGDEFAAPGSPGQAEGEATDPGERSEGGVDSAASALPPPDPTDDSAERNALWTQVMSVAGAAGASKAAVQQEWEKFADGETFNSADITLCREFAEYVKGSNAFADGGAA